MLKRLSFISVSAALLFTGCTIVKPSYDASNQKVLENTMTKIALGEALKGKVPSGSNVALRSMEHKKSLDEPVDSLIQDIAVRSLVNNGFRTLERDEDALSNLRLEDDKKLKVEVEQTTIVDDLEVGKLQINSMTDLMIPTETLISSGFNSADYVLSYRVLEAGVTYHSLDDGFQWEDLATKRWWLQRFFPWVVPEELDRESMIRLHVRAIKTKTGEIVYADNLMAVENKTIEKKLADKLKDYHFDFFNPGLPVQEEDEEESRPDVAKATDASPLDSILNMFRPTKETSTKKMKKGTASTINVDVLVGLDRSYTLQAGYAFSFGIVQAHYHVLTSTSTTNSLLSTTYNDTSLLYTYPVGFFELHAGWDMGSSSTLDSLSKATTTNTATQNLTYGASVKLLDLLNIKAHYFFYNDNVQTLSISMGLTF